jgi:CBS domain-containing protein
VALAELEEVPHEDWPTTLVRERMAPLEEVPVVAPGDDLARAVDRMSVSGIGRALVIHEGFLVGMLSPGDVLRALELRRQAAAAAAERSSQPSSR